MEPTGSNGWAGSEPAGSAQPINQAESAPGAHPLDSMQPAPLTAAPVDQAAPEALTEPAAEGDASLGEQALGPKEARRAMRKRVNGTAGRLFLYELLVLAITTVYLNAAVNAGADMVMHSGIAMSVAVLLALPIMLAGRGHGAVRGDVIVPHRPMTMRSFWALAATALALKLVAAVAVVLISNWLGVAENVTANGVGQTLGLVGNWSLIVYMCLIAPIVEELVFRVAVLRRLKPYGRTFAVVVSSMLFGIMHMNLGQGIIGFFMGLLLGYVAIEYSVKWSIVLHAANNVVLGLLMGGLVMTQPEPIPSLLIVSLLLASLIASIVVFVRTHKRLRAQLASDRTAKGAYLAAFTAPMMLIYIACCAAIIAGRLTAPV